GDSRQEMAIGSSALDALAAQIRGVAWLLFLRPDGSLAYRDGVGGPFFERYVVAALQSERIARELRTRTADLNIQSTAQLWDLIPGVTLCAAPYIERRQLQGVLVLAGKCPGFELSEDVHRLCGALKLDAAWLAGQAQNIAGQTRENLGIVANMF